MLVFNDDYWLSGSEAVFLLLLKILLVLLDDFKFVFCLELFEMRIWVFSSLL